MEKRLEKQIKKISEEFLQASKNKDIYVVSHFDTDGITSASIIIKTLKKLDKKFSLKIVKSLEEEFIYDLPKNKLILFLDLASGCLDYISESKLEDVFIIDHHEVIQEIPEKVKIINPELMDKEKLSASCLTYLFCKEINPEIKESAKLAVLGMIGDMLEKDINQINHNIVSDGQVQKRRGLLIYPSTRPLNRTLEFCSNPYIPEVTGNIKGVLELLREINLNPINGKYQSILELDDNEMKRLITAIMLRNPKTKNEQIVGDIFLLKLFNKLEDARELSAMINACSRYGESGIAIQACLEISKAKKKAELIHAKYKQLLISGLKFAAETEKIQGKGFIIINAKNHIKDTMIGTIASILSNSSLYEEGTMIITMAYYDDKIKISSRIAGRTGKNIREILTKIVSEIGGEVGGHEFAAGAIISKDKEQDFIEGMKKSFELEVVKI